LFERQARPVADPGFGSYWTVNLTAPPGTKRPRKRGRPNKDKHDDIGSPPVKRRGRPRKKPLEQKDLTHEAANQDEEDEEEGETLANDDEEHISEDEYESEEGMVYHALPSFGFEKSTNIIDHLKIEMAGLRRQSADAVSVSLRMSDQLAEAQADASRARAALRTAERMLEDEARKRREAEREADEEARRRRLAEDALRTLQMRCSSSAPT
jgi:hypothetical protein